ncbi:hypothetical protein BT67DRAFT_435815 [Trichocladium antarcticum]|uniref:YDG domain-containing protein n=1 Tax=Trichocladium antarcticum TaxID=1450529 RepID=A0AAN6ZBY1_9PEZI|nr:hypothetical protein BT67DRAFT_435815 [Trichocladium antarcticum]
MADEDVAPHALGSPAGETHTFPAAAAAIAPTPAHPAAAVIAGPRAGGEQEARLVWTGSYAKGKREIVKLVQRSRRHLREDLVPPTEAELDARRNRVRAYLWHLEFATEATPRLKKDPNNVDRALALLFKDEQSLGFVPDDIATQAAAISAKFQQANWGANAPPRPPSTLPPLPPLTNSTGNVRLPPANHPIWGRAGIMHGLMLVHGPTRAIYQFDPRYLAQKRDAKVFGHNGLTPGDWWPLQHVALYHGAHGHSMRGICGSPARGTYSVVVSGRGAHGYGGLDQDGGDAVSYSADSSFLNRCATAIPHVSDDTRSLQRSLATGRPVRVLRSAGSNRPHGPSVGIRYDGLYRVVAEVQARNALGGLYYKFDLVRAPAPLNPRPLADICARVPTAAQRNDESLFRQGY